MGQTGPLSDYAGFGNLGRRLRRLLRPDRLAGSGARPVRLVPTPITCRLGTAWPPCSPPWTTATAPARASTSTSLRPKPPYNFLGPVIVSHAVGGTGQGRLGNRDADMAPHGVYPAAGDDQWIAIACQSDQQWKALCALLGRPDLADDPGLTSAAGRLARADEVDAELARSTAVLNAAVGGPAAPERGHRRPCRAEQPGVLHRPPAPPPRPFRPG